MGGINRVEVLQGAFKGWKFIDVSVSAARTYGPSLNGWVISRSICSCIQGVGRGGTGHETLPLQQQH